MTSPWDLAYEYGITSDLGKREYWNSLLIWKKDSSLLYNIDNKKEETEIYLSDSEINTEQTKTIVQNLISELYTQMSSNESVDTWLAILKSNNCFFLRCFLNIATQCTPFNMKKLCLLDTSVLGQKDMLVTESYYDLPRYTASSKLSVIDQEELALLQLVVSAISMYLSLLPDETIITLSNSVYGLNCNIPDVLDNTKTSTENLTQVMLGHIPTFSSTPTSSLNEKDHNYTLVMIPITLAAIIYSLGLYVSPSLAQAHGQMNCLRSCEHHIKQLLSKNEHVFSLTHAEDVEDAEENSSNNTNTNNDREMVDYEYVPFDPNTTYNNNNVDIIQHNANTTGNECWERVTPNYLKDDAEVALHHAVCTSIQTIIQALTQIQLRVLSHPHFTQRLHKKHLSLISSVCYPLVCHGLMSVEVLLALNRKVSSLLYRTIVGAVIVTDIALSTVGNYPSQLRERYLKDTQTPENGNGNDTPSLDSATPSRSSDIVDHFHAFTLDQCLSSQLCQPNTDTQHLTHSLISIINSTDLDQTASLVDSLCVYYYILRTNSTRSSLNNADYVIFSGPDISVCVDIFLRIVSDNLYNNPLVPWIIVCLAVTVSGFPNLGEYTTRGSEITTVLQTYYDSMHVNGYLELPELCYDDYSSLNDSSVGNYVGGGVSVVGYLENMYQKIKPYIISDVMMALNHAPVPH